MDLHLARLRAASVDFFGAALPDESLRSFMRIAIEDGSCEQSLTVTIFSRSGEFTSAGIGSEPAALVRTGPPSKGPIGPLRLAVVNFERPLPLSNTSVRRPKPTTCIRRSGKVSTMRPSSTGAAD
ncbi:hypothetical protein [Sinorhizobium medicae]